MQEFPTLPKSTDRISPPKKSEVLGKSADSSRLTILKYSIHGAVLSPLTMGRAYCFESAISISTQIAVCLSLYGEITLSVATSGSPPEPIQSLHPSDRPCRACAMYFVEPWCRVQKPLICTRHQCVRFRICFLP